MDGTIACTQLRPDLVRRTIRTWAGEGVNGWASQCARRSAREVDSVAGKKDGDDIVIGSLLGRKHVMKDVPRRRLNRVLPG
jgi:hypothetical protein